jgi:transposase
MIMARGHSDEFKREAVRIALTSGLSRKQVASDLGVGFSTLAKWVHQSKPDNLPSSADIDLAKENERLRKENRLLMEEYPSWSSHFFDPFTLIAQ